MLENEEKIMGEHVEFISYTGRYPNLCRGALTLKIDGEKVTFGYDYFNPNAYDHEPFWKSGGEVGSSGSDCNNLYASEGEWIIDVKKIPIQYRKYAREIDTVFNENIEHGCCGGCI